MTRSHLAILVSIAAVAAPACGGHEPIVAVPTAPPDAEVTPAVTADATPDAAPDAAIDAAFETVGAVPLPGDGTPLPLEEVDTTVRDDDLAALPIHKPTRVARSGRQLVALWTRTKDRRVMLALVEDQNGIVAEFPIAASDGTTTLHGSEGNTYSPRAHLGEYTGPIVFAIRVRDTAHDAWQQIVVFASGATLRVVARTLGESKWRSRLDLQLRADATFEGIGTTDPH